MLNFMQYINEVRLYHAGSDKGGVRARSGAKQSSFPSHLKPIWLGHSSKQTRKDYYNTMKDKKSRHFSKMKVQGKVAHHRDPEVKKLLHKHGHDTEKYHDMLSFDPHHRDVHSHPATVTLQTHGYKGYTHPDTQAGHPQYKARSRKIYNKQLAKNIMKHGTKAGKEATGKREDKKFGDPNNTVVFHRKHTETERVLRKRR